MTDVKKDTVTITVDGRDMEAKPGELLIEAAERNGIYIPRFCWHKRMDPVGACRMCLVDIEGSPPIPGSQQRRPQTSCTSVVREGMVVHTQFSSPEINDAQKTILELLLINHPLDCPICDRGGECPLQDQTQDYGPSESRFIEQKRRFEKPVPISPLINLDRERCILCYRCTRFCEELSGDVLIGTMNRGPEAFIFPYYKLDSQENGNGHGDDDAVRGPSAFDINETFDSYFSGNTIQICPVGALTSTEYRFMARPWDMNNVGTTCNLCACGCAINAGVRVQDGNVARISAGVNEETNEEWLCDKGRFGNGYISSSHRLTQPLVRRDEGLVQITWDEAFNVMAEKLQPVLGGDKDAAVIVGGHLCDEDYYAAQKFARMALRTNNVDHRTEPGLHASALVAPGVTYEDVLSSDLVVVVGADLREELPILFLRMRIAAMKRGLRIAEVGPRRTALRQYASVAEADVDQALRNASNAVILLGPRACSPDVVSAWSDRAQGARISWLPRRANVIGALAAGAHPDLLPGWRTLDDDIGDIIPANEGLDVKGIFAKAKELGVLWLVGADLMDVPGGAQALEDAPFVVVQDVQMTRQLDHADLVLPAAVFAERDGTLTNWEGRRQAVFGAVDPPGSARADYAILAESARRLGRPIGCRTQVAAKDELDALLEGRTPPTAPTTATAAAVPAADGLRLLTYRLLYDDGLRIRDTEGIRELTPGSFVEINPDDARGITDGASVRVSTAHGSVTVRASVTNDIDAGTVFVPWKQWGVGACDLVTLDDPTPTVTIEAS